MKRNTPLTRSPMPRAGKPMKRKRPKYPSAAQLKERQAWGQQWDRCWLCGSPRNTQIHEIASRAQAPLHWCCVENFFFSCESCNMGPLNALGEDFQLAVKFLNDPDNYDRELVNSLRHRAANAISESEVQYLVSVLRWNRIGA